MKLKSAEELKKECEKKVLELQKVCPHKKSSWGFSFIDRAYTGYKIKVCEFCGKILRRRKADWKKSCERLKSEYLKMLRKQGKQGFPTENDPTGSPTTNEKGLSQGITFRRLEAK